MLNIMDLKAYGAKQYFVFILLGAAALAFYFVIRSFLLPIVYAFLIAYFFSPFKKYLDKKISPKASAFIIIGAIVAILFFAAYFFSSQLYVQLENYINSKAFDNSWGKISEYFSWLPQQAQDYAKNLSAQARSVILGWIFSFAKTLPHTAIAVFITLFVSYFMLADFSSLDAFVKKLISSLGKEELANRTAQTAKKIAYGYATIALVEFAIALVGFKVAGSSLYLILALMIGISAFVPAVGPFAIWFPAFLVYLFQQNYFSAAAILVTGIIITGAVEHFLSYVFVGKGSGVHPAVMLVGVLGGVPVFGIFGFILGPVAIIFFWELAKELLAPPRTA